MKSSGTPRFWQRYRQLPEEVRRAARKQYQLWQADPSHRSLHFKPIGKLWSVRVTDDYRALAIYEEGTYHWFWIGTHADYDRLLKAR